MVNAAEQRAEADEIGELTFSIVVLIGGRSTKAIECTLAALIACYASRTADPEFCQRVFNLTDKVLAAKSELN